MLQSVQRVRRDINELEEVITQLEAEKRDLQHKYDEESKCTNKLHDKITELEGAAKQSAVEKANLQECVDTLSRDITTLQGDLRQSREDRSKGRRLKQKQNDVANDIDQMVAEATANLFTMSNKDISELLGNIHLKVAMLRSLPQPEEETEEQQPKKTPARVKTARKDRRTLPETGPPKNMQRNKPISQPRKK